VSTEAENSDPEGTERPPTTPSRPVTAVVVKKLPVLYDDDDEAPVDAAELVEFSSTAVDAPPGSPPQVTFSRPSTRSTMWDLPPLMRVSTAPSVSLTVSVEPFPCGGGDLIEACAELSIEMGAEVGNDDNCANRSGCDGAEEPEVGGVDGRNSDADQEPGPETTSAASSTVDLDVAHLLKDLTLQRVPPTSAGASPAVTPPTDAFVHRRNARSASIANGVLNMSATTHGAPQSGMRFNVVRASEGAMEHVLHAALNKGRVTAVKGLPLLDKPLPHRTKPVVPKKPKTQPPLQKEPTAEPPTAPTEADTAVRGQEACTPIPPGKSRGLYLIPGSAVSSLAQRPSSEKPARPVVYTTRVLVQQKLREYMNSPDKEYLELPVPSATQFKHTQRVYLQPSPALVAPAEVRRPSPARDSSGMLFNDSVLANEGSASTVMDSGGLSEQVSDFHFTERKLSAAAPNDTARLSNSQDKERIQGDTHSADEGGDDGGLNLQLSVAEWSQILDAARQEALCMDLDIVQGGEAPPNEEHSLRGDGHGDRPMSVLPTPNVRPMSSMVLPLGEVDDPVSVMDFLHAQLEDRSDLQAVDRLHQPVTAQRLLDGGVPATEHAAFSACPASKGSHLAQLNVDGDCAWHPTGRPLSPNTRLAADHEFAHYSDHLYVHYGIPDVRKANEKSRRHSPPRAPHPGGSGASHTKQRVSPPRSRPARQSPSHHSSEDAEITMSRLSGLHQFLLRGTGPPLLGAQDHRGSHLEKPTAAGASQDRTPAAVDRGTAQAAGLKADASELSLDCGSEKDR
jgi:hypothetical protein